MLTTTGQFTVPGFRFAVPPVSLVDRAPKLEVCVLAKANCSRDNTRIPSRYTLRRGNGGRNTANGSSFAQNRCRRTRMPSNDSSVSRAFARAHQRLYCGHRRGHQHFWHSTAPFLGHGRVRINGTGNSDFFFEVLNAEEWQL